ncbi:MAG TPA: glycosyltransferase family 4 protein [Bryobacteraceae bacterium]|nr:glycosyltransferase family 4 protein [Bryobacteraceae bacterium]
MRVLLLDQFSEPGGAQRCLLDLLPAIRECGWDALVGLPGGGSLFQRVHQAGFETARIECGPYQSGGKSAADLGRFLSGTPRLARQVRRLAERVDVVYVNGPRLLPAVALAGLRVPVVFHSHSYLPSGIVRKLAAISLRRMNARVVASCRFVAQPWRACGPVAVVWNGVGACERKAAVRLTERVGCIGRIAPEKGQREFVAAAAIIHRALPECRFAIHGSAMFSAAGYEAEVRAAAAGLPVQFPGWTENVCAALGNLDLLLVPSAPDEATPRVILEAFAAGVPVVAFASGGIPEMIEHGVDGFLAASTEEMAEIAIGLLAGDRAEVAQAARESWRRKFTLERYRQEMISILKRAAATPASAAAPASTGP